MGFLDDLRPGGPPAYKQPTVDVQGVVGAWTAARTMGGLSATPHVGDVDKLITASKLLEPVVIPVSALASAQILSRGSLLKPPQARLMFTDGRHFDVGILWSPTTWNLSPKNRVAFDDFLSKLPVPVS